MEKENVNTNQFSNMSRGHKTKGYTYKDRYVEEECPECGYPRSYKDEWKLKIAYTCLRRSCRHKFYKDKFES